MTAMPTSRSSVDVPSTPNLSTIIDALGERRFETELLSFLHAIGGADHCAIFRVGPDDLSEVASASLDGSDTAHQQANLYLGGQFWRRDPAIQAARHVIPEGRASIVRMQVDEIRDAEFRDAIYRRKRIKERVLICGRRGDASFGLSILRSESHGPFGAPDLQRLTSASEILMSLLRKHAALRREEPNVAASLRSVDMIEAVLADATPRLSKRELQVCARLLGGLAASAIARDLGIGDESVATYRKRAYHRLGITSKHELMLWYLDLWRAKRFQ